MFSLITTIYVDLILYLFISLSKGDDIKKLYDFEIKYFI